MLNKGSLLKIKQTLIIQQEIAKSKARAEAYGKHDTKSIDGRSQL